MKRWLTVSFGGVTDWERAHLGDEASGMNSAWGKHPGDEASRMNNAQGKHLDERCPGSRAPGRIDRAFLGRLAFGPGPMRALGLAGWLGLGPWIPHFGSTNLCNSYLKATVDRHGGRTPLGFASSFVREVGFSRSYKLHSATAD